MKSSTIAAAAAALALAPSALAWHFDTRWVERVGNIDILIFPLGLPAPGGTTHRIRLQMGVFDDDQSAAPGGGILG